MQEISRFWGMTKTRRFQQSKASVSVNRDMRQLRHAEVSQQAASKQQESRINNEYQ